MASVQDFMSQWNQFKNMSEWGKAAQMASPYFNTDLINKYFNTSAGNIAGAGGTQANLARQNAGSLANAYGMLNPGGFTMNAGSQAFQPFANALNQNEVSRAGALQQNQGNLFQAIFGLMNANRQYGLQQQQLEAQTQPNIFDYLGLGTSLLSLPTGGGISLLGRLAGWK